MELLLLAALLLVLGILLHKGYKNTKHIVLNKVRINDQNENQTVLRILHLSDLHLENISISPNQLFDALKDETIDLIALTGDFLDRRWTIPKLVPYLQALNKLQAKHGMVAVLGNHDYVLKGKNLEKLVHTLEQNHCRVMQNENWEIFIHGKRINIIGVDDFSTKRSNLKAAYLGVKQGFNLVLTHDPNLVLQMQKYHFDYLLSGHFHGGQICYPKAYHLVKMGKLVRMNMIKGLQTYDNKSFYISEGLGQTGLNIRFGSRPEITIHECYLSDTESEKHLLSS